MELKIENIKIKKFRKFKDYETDFQDINIIYGKNGSGKTTLIDAISWCLFGKNLEDITFETNKFESDGSLVEQDTLVELNLTVNELPTKIIREFKNSRTKIVVDGVPKDIKEYNSYLEKNILAMDNLKIFLNPSHFNNNLHWKEKRKMLMEYFDSPSNEELIEEYDFKPTSNFFMKELKLKSPEDILLKYKNSLKSEVEDSQKYNAQIEYLEGELLEKENEDIDIDKYEKEKKELEDKVSQEISNINKKEKLVRKKNDIEYRLENSSFETENTKYLKLKMKYDNIKEKYHTVSEEYKKLKAIKIETTCPTCKQELPKTEMAVIQKEHKDKVNAIVEKGKLLKTQLTDAEKVLKETDKITMVDKLSKKQRKNMQEEVKLIKREIETIVTPADSDINIDELNKKIREIEYKIKETKEIEEINKKLKGFIDKQKELAATIEEYENTIEDAERFIKLRTANVVSKVNKNFKNIKINLFNEQKNGNIKETFEITRNGVPYSDVNATGKLTAGLELLNFLKKSMKINIPIIIDNFERYPSIDIDNLGKSQAILVVASKGKADKLGDFKVLNKEEYEGVKNNG